MVGTKITTVGGEKGVAALEHRKEILNLFDLNHASNEIFVFEHVQFRAD